MHLFDEGWYKLREKIFANQKRLGVIPADAKLTPWPDDLIKHWDQLNDTEKKLSTKQADVFAAYVAYTDHEIGRVIQTVKELEKLFSGRKRSATRCCRWIPPPSPVHFCHGPT